MPLIDHKQLPSESMRRWFGFSLAALFLILAYVLRHNGTLVASILAGIGLFVGGVYYAFSRSQLPIIRIWQIVTLPIAFVVSHVLLGAVFFGVVLPIGLLLRLMKYDPLRLKDQARDSEWIAKERNFDVTRYFKQF